MMILRPRKILRIASGGDFTDAANVVSCTQNALASAYLGL